MYYIKKKSQFYPFSNDLLRELVILLNVYKYVLEKFLQLQFAHKHLFYWEILKYCRPIM